MKRVLILCAHRPGRSPSQRYRFEQYIPFLEKHGFTFTYSYLLNEKDDTLFYSDGKLPTKIRILLKSFFIRLMDCFRFRKYNIIFIQREAYFLGTSFFERQASRSGAHVIFDFDDSIWLADTSPGNKKWEKYKKPEKFFRNVSLAHAVIAGNKYLAQKAIEFNKNTIVIPTTVDTDFHVPQPELRNKGVVTIGWSGSLSTIKHFESLLPVLIKVKERCKDKVKIKLIGEKTYSNPSLKVEAVEWRPETEVAELNSIDIGIMPLPDDEWARGKCGLKGLTYMACGIPAILSEVGMNKEIISHGRNGFLAENDSEWYYLLCGLIDDEESRLLIGTKGREKVVEKFSVEANKNKYLEVFQNAVRH